MEVRNSWNRKVQGKVAVTSKEKDRKDKSRELEEGKGQGIGG